METCIAGIVSKYLNNTPVYFVLGAYNDFLPVTDPATGEINHIFGIETWIKKGKRNPTFGGNFIGGFYAGALYVIRDKKMNYRIGEVNGRFQSSTKPLVATRCYALSPFPSDQGNVIYSGGYDGNNILSSNMAWIFKTTLSNMLR